MQEDLSHYDKMQSHYRDHETPDDLEGSELIHVHLGSRQKSSTISELEKSRLNDTAFHGFSTKLKKFLKQNLPAQRVDIVGDEVASSNFYNQPI